VEKDPDHRAGESPAPSPRSSGGRKTRAKNRGDAATRPNLAVLRHQARVLALQVIFEADVTDHPLAEIEQRTFADPEEQVPPEVSTYAQRLVRGFTGDRERIDALIAEAAPAFPIAQLASVDRNVLRIAVYELLHEPHVPAKAAINEAIEIAKRFGGTNSSRFVNGVLGTVLQRIQRDGRSAPA
jgi:N utilization substance protein B